MKTSIGIKNLVAKNPRAKESDIRRALKILATVDALGPEPNVAEDRSKRMFPADFVGEDEPRRVRLSGSR